MTRYAMAIDMAACMGCQTCVVACQMENGLLPGMARTAVEWVEGVPGTGLAMLPHGCLHCDEPRCVKVCPTGASWRRDDGIVAVDADRCIGCGVCVTACAFGARTIPAHDDFYFGAAEASPYEVRRRVPVGVADKCDFCADAVGAGRQPACVRSCPAGARLFGDAEDPESAVSRFATARECRGVPDTAVAYASGACEVDVQGLLSTAFFKPARHEGAPGWEPEPREPNFAVVGAAGAAVAATAVGIGLYKAGRSS